MPKWNVNDEAGNAFIVEGDEPPSEEDLNGLFADYRKQQSAVAELPADEGSDWLGIGDEVRGIGGGLMRGLYGAVQTERIENIRQGQAARDYSQVELPDQLKQQAAEAERLKSDLIESQKTNPLPWREYSEKRQALSAAASDARMKLAVGAGVERQDRISAESIAANQKKIEALPLTAAQEEFNKPESSAWSFFRNPVEIAAITTAESLPSMVKGMVGAPLGPAGLAVSQGLASQQAESSARIKNSMTADGVDLKDPDSVMAWFKDRVKSDPAIAKADIAALGPGFFDALTAGMGGVFLRKALGMGAKKVAVATAKEIAMQMAGGALGSATGSTLAGEDIDPKDILLEMAAEVAPVEAITNVRGEIARNANQSVRDMGVRLPKAMEGGAATLPMPMQIEGGESDASKVSKTATVHGDVRQRAGETEVVQGGQPEGGAGVQPQSKALPLRNDTPLTAKESLERKQLQAKARHAQITTAEAEKLADLSKRPNPGGEFTTRTPLTEYERKEYKFLSDMFYKGEEMSPDEEASLNDLEQRARAEMMQRLDEDPQSTLDEKEKQMLEVAAIKNRADIAWAQLRKKGEESSPFAKNSIATIDRKNGRIVLNPKIVRAMLDGLPVAKQQEALDSLISEEMIHLHTDDSTAMRYWKSLGKLQQKISNRIYTDTFGGKFKTEGGEMVQIDEQLLAHEALRRHIQHLRGLTPTEISQWAKRGGFTVQALDSIDRAINGIKRTVLKGTKLNRDQMEILDGIQKNIREARVQMGGQEPMALRREEEIADSIDHTFKPVGTFDESGMPSELVAQLKPLADKFGWEFTNKKTGITFYTRKGASQQEIASAYKAKYGKEMPGAVSEPMALRKLAEEKYNLKFDGEYGGRMMFTIQDKGPTYEVQFTVPSGSTEEDIAAKKAATERRFTGGEPMALRKSEDDSPVRLTSQSGSRKGDEVLITIDPSTGLWRATYFQPMEEGGQHEAFDHRLFESKSDAIKSAMGGDVRMANQRMPGFPHPIGDSSFSESPWGEGPLSEGSQPMALRKGMTKAQIKAIEELRRYREAMGQQPKGKQAKATGSWPRKVPAKQRTTASDYFQKVTPKSIGEEADKVLSDFTKPPSFQRFVDFVRAKHGDVQPGQVYEAWRDKVTKYLETASGERLTELVDKLGLRRQVFGKIKSKGETIQLTGTIADKLKDTGGIELARSRALEKSKRLDKQVDAMRVLSRSKFAKAEGLRKQGLTAEADNLERDAYVLSQKAALKESQSKAYEQAAVTGEGVRLEQRELLSDLEKIAPQDYRDPVKGPQTRARDRAVSAIYREMTMNEPSLREGLARREINVDDIRWSEMGNDIIRVTTPDLDDTFQLGQELTQGAGTSASTKAIRGGGQFFTKLQALPRSATKRVVALLDKQSGKVHLVSAYRDGRRGPVFYNPGSLTGQHVEIDQLLERYRPLYSLPLDRPVKDFHQVFASMKDFNDRFYNQISSRAQNVGYRGYRGVEDADEAAAMDEDGLPPDAEFDPTRHYLTSRAGSDIGATEIGEGEGEGGMFQGPESDEVKAYLGMMEGELGTNADLTEGEARAAYETFRVMESWPESAELMEQLKQKATARAANLDAGLYDRINEAQSEHDQISDDLKYETGKTREKLQDRLDSVNASLDKLAARLQPDFTPKEWNLISAMGKLSKVLYEQYPQRKNLSAGEISDLTINELYSIAQKAKTEAAYVAAAKAKYAQKRGFTPETSPGEFRPSPFTKELTMPIERVPPTVVRDELGRRKYAPAEAKERLRELRAEAAAIEQTEAERLGISQEGRDRLSELESERQAILQTEEETATNPLTQTTDYSGLFPNPTTAKPTGVLDLTQQKRPAGRIRTGTETELEPIAETPGPREFAGEVMSVQEQQKIPLRRVQQQIDVLESKALAGRLTKGEAKALEALYADRAVLTVSEIAENILATAYPQEAPAATVKTKKQLAQEAAQQRAEYEAENQGNLPLSGTAAEAGKIELPRSMADNPQAKTKKDRKESESGQGLMPMALRRDRPGRSLGEFMQNTLMDFGSIYDTWMVDRIDQYGGPVSKKAASGFRYIIDRKKELYGGLTQLLDRARRLAGGVESSRVSPNAPLIKSVVGKVKEAPWRIRESAKAMRAVNWMNKINYVTPDAGTANMIWALEGRTEVPEFAQSLTEAADAANREIGGIVEPVTEDFKANGGVQRNITGLGYDIIRMGGGALWERWTRGLAAANHFTVKAVQDHFRSIKADMDVPQYEGSTIEKINQDMARIYPEVITHIKHLGSWQPVVHSDLFNYLENAAQRASHVRAFREQFPNTEDGRATFNALIRTMKTELASEPQKDLDALIRSLHGHPTDDYSSGLLNSVVGPQTTLGGVGRALNSTVNNLLAKMVLTGQMVTQTGESIAGGGPQFLGWKNHLEAMRRVGDLYNQLEITGAVNRVFHDYTWNSNSKMRSVFRIGSNALSKLTAQAALNEFQEAGNAAQAFIVSEHIRNGTLSPFEKRTLPQTFQMMGFNRKEAKTMMGNQQPDTADQEELLRQFQRKAASFLSGGNKDIAEGSRFGANRAFNSVFRFQLYPMTKLNQGRKLVVNLVDQFQNGTGKDKKVAVEMMARFIGGNIAQGAITSAVASLAFGGLSGLKIKMKEAEDEPLAFIAESLMASMSGPLYMLYRAGQAGGIFGVGEQAARMAFPYSIMQDMGQMSNGDGQYKDKDWPTRIGLFLSNKTPMTKMIKTGLAMSGLAMKNHELDTSIKALNRWKSDEFGFSKTLDRRKQDEGRPMRVQVVKAIEAMKRGDEEGFYQAWMDALEVSDRKSIAESLQSRKVLRVNNQELTPEQVEALQKRIGMDAYNRLEYYDLMLDYAARGVMVE